MVTSELENLLRYALDCHRKGMLREAEAGYRRALEIHPDYPDALHLLGMMAYQKGNLASAEKLIRDAIAACGQIPVFYSSLGLALLAGRRVTEAIEAFKRASEMNPNVPEFFIQLGAAYFQNEQLEPAERANRRAIELAPDNAEARYNMGNCLVQRERFDEAFDEYAKASRLRARWSPPVANQGVILRRLERLDESAERFQAAIAMSPNDPSLYGNLGSVLKDLGLLNQAVEVYKKGLSLNPDHAKTRSNLILTLFYMPDLPRAVIDRELEAWERHVAGPLKGPAMELRPAEDRKIRVGFVSPDFRMHPAGVMAAPVLSGLDRTRFEVYAYGEMLWKDDWTEVCRKSVDVFKETQTLSDDRLAEMIRADRIDILVDLASHTSGNRLVALARKPAPIMGTWLAYCESTGMKAMDFRISDPWMDPSDGNGVEKVVRLPRCYWCYPTPTLATEIGRLPAKTNGYVVFGCLNTFCKINAKVITAFASVLKGVEGSRLILGAPAGSARDRVLREFSAAGIDASRVLFVERTPWEEYLNIYNQIDVGLDVFPFNGGMTTCDALWMGVPVVTLAGGRGVSRAGLSILNNVGLPELAADSPDEYVRIAREWAGDLNRLEELRMGLRDRLRSSPLMDMNRFVKDMESALLGLLPFEASLATIVK
jgi:protein O-GlcNAc transferase